MYQKTDQFDNSIVTTDTTETTDYAIRPTLGISYLVNDNFSLSIDAGIGYSSGKEEISSDDGTLRSKDTDRIYTTTELLFRYYF